MSQARVRVDRLQAFFRSFHRVRDGIPRGGSSLRIPSAALHWSVSLRIRRSDGRARLGVLKLRGQRHAWNVADAGDCAINRAETEKHNTTDSPKCCDSEMNAIDD